MNKQKIKNDSSKTAPDPLPVKTAPIKAAETEKPAAGPAITLTGAAVSIYIHDIGIKVLQTGVNGGIQKWAAVTLTPGLVTNGQINDPPAVAEVLVDLLKANGLKPEKAIVGMSGLHSISRNFVLPRAARSVLNEAVRHEAERELPVSLDSVYLYWRVISNDSGNLQIFLIAYEKNIINTTVKTLHLAGIKSFTLELAPIALMRVADSDAAAVFNIRPGEFDIIGLENSFPRLIRSLPLPADKPAGDNFPVIGKELERTIRYFYPDQDAVNGKIIQGSGIYNNGHDVYYDLSAQVGLAVKPLVPAIDCPDGFPAADYMVNIGLVSDASKGKKLLKLLKIDLKPPKPKARLGGLKYAFLLAAIAAISMVGLKYLQRDSQSITDISKQLTACKTLLTSRMASQRDLIGLTDRVTQAESVPKALNAIGEQFAAGNRLIIQDMQNIITLLPEGVSFSSLRYEDGLSIEGSALTRDLALGYGTQLMKTGDYSKLIIASLQQNNLDNKYYFRFIFTREK